MNSPSGVGLWWWILRWSPGWKKETWEYCREACLQVSADRALMDLWPGCIQNIMGTCEMWDLGVECCFLSKGVQGLFRSHSLTLMLESQSFVIKCTDGALHLVFAISVSLWLLRTNPVILSLHPIRALCLLSCTARVVVSYSVEARCPSAISVFMPSPLEH